MDRLRALDYFLSAARLKSFSAAARGHDVSVQAVAKLVTSLEADLGIELFQRSAHGLLLSAAGERYLDACAPLLERLREADEDARASIAPPRAGWWSACSTSSPTAGWRTSCHASTSATRTSSSTSATFAM